MKAKRGRDRVWWKAGVCRALKDELQRKKITVERGGEHSSDLSLIITSSNCNMPGILDLIRTVGSRDKVNTCLIEVDDESRMDGVNLNVDSNAPRHVHSSFFPILR
jgi:hypothetical protein